jgi:adenosylcobinamide kinase / adenosylcobinamide-phosphate guanylyltransferase
MTASRTLVLGGARSGKSRRAEALALSTGLEPVYLATAQALDDEMRQRIAEHRARRGPGWRTVEEPIELGSAITAASRRESVVLVDCLTLWLSNVMLAGRDAAEAESLLLDSVRAAPGPLVLVSNEVGLGLVPETPLGRAFRDAQGRLNQAVAALATRVELVAAGLPLILKPQAA